MGYRHWRQRHASRCEQASLGPLKAKAGRLSSCQKWHKRMWVDKARGRREEHRATGRPCPMNRAKVSQTFFAPPGVHSLALRPATCSWLLLGFTMRPWMHPKSHSAPSSHSGSCTAGWRVQACQDGATNCLGPWQAAWSQMLSASHRQNSHKTAWSLITALLSGVSVFPPAGHYTVVRTT
jgi:hypothetical protein